MNTQGKKFWDGSITLSPAAKQYHDAHKITYPYDGNLIDLTFYVSCYNEEQFIVNTLDTIVQAMSLLNKTYEIIVIDDCSQDSSANLVKKYIKQHPEINIVLRINAMNKGWAQNYIDGAFIGKGKYYRTMCGDNSEPIQTIIDVVQMIGEADIIVPYYISAQGKSWYRLFISKLYTKIINLISGNKINYYNGLHVHLRNNVMRWQFTTHGFGFQASLLCLLLKMGFSYKQVPCITIERRGGRGNAITWKNLLSVMHMMASILLRRLAHRNRNHKNLTQPKQYQYHD